MAAKLSLQIQSTEPFNGEMEVTNIGYVNHELLREGDRGAAKINTCARAIISLSQNTYRDTLLVTSESINEMLEA